MAAPRSHAPGTDPKGQWTPNAVLNTALARVIARAGRQFRPLDPTTLLHVEERTVSKRGIEVALVHFWHEQLRPWTTRSVEVRYDAAAADRGHLHEIVVRLGSGADATLIRCQPKAVMQNTLDRDEVRQHSKAYRDRLRAEVEAAEVGSARRARGAGAAARQAALHRTRRAQGRPGQEHSGHRAPRPEVEEGVRAHQEAALARKVKNSRRTAKTSTGKRAPAGRTGAGPAAPPSASAPSGWQELARAADGRRAGKWKKQAG